MQNNVGKTNLGIIGGTFDPIHLGHIGCAEAAYENFDLDEIWFMPAGLSNFKKDKQVSDVEDRINMCKLALNDHCNKNFKLCDLESKREGVSYTSDSLDILHEKNKNANLFFITGSDAAFSLNRWYKIEHILDLATVIAVFRQGYNLPDDKQLDFLDKNADRIKLLEADVVDVSSSDIRQRIKSNKPVDQYLSPSVYKYIIDNNLY